MGAISKRWRSIVAAALILGATGGGLVASQTSASQQKTYSISGSPSGVSSAGTRVSVVLTNTMTGQNISFAAANLTLVDGLVPDTSEAAAPMVSGGATVGTATWNGNVLEVRGLNVSRRAPNNTVTVAFTMRAPATTSSGCGDYRVSSDVRQSNNFSGTGNEFVAPGGNTLVFTNPSCAVQVCVNNQPCLATVQGGNSTATLEVGNNNVDARLTASLSSGSIECRGAPNGSSDQLFFNIEPLLSWNAAGFTKTVTFEVPKALDVAVENHQLCFRAPYEFPAFPIEYVGESWQIGPTDDLVASTNSGFWNQPNRLESFGSDRQGLLVPCTALAPNQTVTVPFAPSPTGTVTAPAPCVNSRVDNGNKVKITFTVPAADPIGRIGFK